jgi:hypothetical protein
MPDAFDAVVVGAGAAAPDLMFWISDPEEPDGFEIDVVLLKPRSRGHVRLRSAEAADPPRIELPGLSERVDVERLAEGCGRALDLAEHPEIRRLCSAPVLVWCAGVAMVAWGPANNESVDTGSLGFWGPWAIVLVVEVLLVVAVDRVRRRRVAAS